MSGEGGVIRHDHMVGDLTVMCDVRSDHKQAVIPDTGNHAAACRARVHRYVFADGVAGADHERRILAAVFEVLGFMPDRGKRKYPRTGADSCAPLDHHMAPDGYAGAQLDLSANSAIWPDYNIGGQPRPGCDDCRWMDLRHPQAVNRQESSLQIRLQPSDWRRLLHGPRISRHCRGCAA